MKKRKRLVDIEEDQQKRNKIERHRGKKTKYKSQEVKNAKEKAKRISRRIEEKMGKCWEKRKESEL